MSPRTAWERRQVRIAQRRLRKIPLRKLWRASKAFLNAVTVPGWLSE